MTHPLMEQVLEVEALYLEAQALIFGNPVESAAFRKGRQTLTLILADLYRLAKLIALEDERLNDA